jgi:long-chain acyl-CoA synthetase
MGFSLLNRLIRGWRSGYQSGRGICASAGADHASYWIRWRWQQRYRGPRCTGSYRRMGASAAQSVDARLQYATQVLPVDPDAIPAALSLGGGVEREAALVWFPEGRRSPNGEITAFMAGVGVLLQRTGAAAVPVRISGTYDAWPRTRRWPRLHRIGVVFGKPLAAADLARSGTNGSEAERIADALRKAVAALPQR